VREVSTATGVTRALRHRAFLSLWSGRTASAFGDGIHRVALAWWVLHTTGSGLAMGTVMVCSLVPMVPFLFIGGALVDRFDPVRLMLYSDIVRGVMTALVAYLIFVDQLEVWHVYVLATVFGVAAAFFYPASAKVMLSSVPMADLPSANSLMSLAQQAANIVGPMAAAMIISVGQSALAFTVDAGTFVFAALSLLPLIGRSLPVHCEAVGRPSMVADVREGMFYVAREPWLWVSILAFLPINLALAPIYAILVPYIIVEVNHDGASVLALVESFAAAGTVAAALWVGRRQQLPRRGLVIFCGVIGVGAISILFGLPLSPLAFAALVAVGAFGNAVCSLAWTSLMQERVPPEMYGRVSSIDLAVSVVILPVGMALVGWGVDRMEPLTICVIGGGLAMLAGQLALLHPQIRQLD
jgi:MFS family permease